MQIPLFSYVHLCHTRNIGTPECRAASPAHCSTWFLVNGNSLEMYFIIGMDKFISYRSNTKPFSTSSLLCHAIMADLSSHLNPILLPQGLLKGLFLFHPITAISHSPCLPNNIPSTNFQSNCLAFSSLSDNCSFLLQLLNN